MCTGEEGHVTRSLVQGSRLGGRLGNKHSKLFSVFLPISYYGALLAEANPKLQGWGSHSYSPHRSTSQGPEQGREMWKVNREGQSAKNKQTVFSLSLISKSAVNIFVDKSLHTFC